MKYKKFNKKLNITENGYSIKLVCKNLSKDEVLEKLEDTLCDIEDFSPEKFSEEIKNGRD